WIYGLPGGLLEDLLPHALSTTLDFIPEEIRLAHFEAKETGRLEGLADELRLSLSGSRTTANITLSLFAKPDDFIINIYGTECTLRIDYQNMLFQLDRLPKGPKALAKGMRVISNNLSAIQQTFANIV